MKQYQKLFVVLTLSIFSLTSLAVEIELIPPKLDAAQRSSFTKERAELIAEKKSTNGRLARYNQQCGNPKPYLANKCNIDRQNMLKTVDKLNNKITDFNKRLAVAEKGPGVNTKQ